MEWASAISTAADSREAVTLACTEIRGQLGEQMPDVVFLFVSPSHRTTYREIQLLVESELAPAVLVGCSAMGIVGRSLEVESGPAISLSAAVMPNTQLSAVHLDLRHLPDTDASPASWREWTGISEAEHFVVLADPFNTTLEDALLGLDYAYPNASKVGGLASGAGKAGENALFVNGELYDAGAVLLSLSGEVGLEPVVAQGCRPVGEPVTVTRSEGNLIHEVNGQPAMAFIQAVKSGLNEYEQTLFKSALFLGVNTDPFVTNEDDVEFLIRNLIGVDHQSGAIVLAGRAEEGALVQVHLRDKKSSRADLQAQLEGYQNQFSDSESVGALLFSCLGRGQYLYGTTNHDCDVITDVLGELPIAGFFCAGEIGPVGASTFIHGYTSSIGVFRTRS